MIIYIYIYMIINIKYACLPGQKDPDIQMFCIWKDLGIFEDIWVQILEHLCVI